MKSVFIKRELANELYPAFTDAQIADGFKCTIAEARQLIKGKIPLTAAAWEEAINLHADANDYTLSKLYNCSMYQIKKWSEGSARASKRVSEIEMREIASGCATPQEAAEKTGWPIYLVKPFIPKFYTKPNMPSKETLAKYDNTSLTHAEIADDLGVSRTWVTKQVSTKHKASTPNKIKDWNAVLEYLKANTLTATAKHFGVTPSAILHRKKRYERTITEANRTP